MADNDWEKFASQGMIDYVHQIENDSDPFMVDFAKFLKVTAPIQIANPHILATPLLDFLSIGIEKETIAGLDDGYPLIEVYGDLRLIDNDNGKEFYIFKRTKGDPLVISMPEGNLFVLIQKSELGGPYELSSSLLLKLRLKDRIRDIDIINCQQVINCAHEIPFDRRLDIKISDSSPLRRRGNFSVGCTVFQSALLVSMDFGVLDIDGNDIDTGAMVSGTISVTFKLMDEWITHVLFDKPNSQKVDLEGYEKLSRFAVPACSTLQIQAHMEVNGEQIGDGFEADDSVCGAFKKEILGTKYRVLVRVSFNHARITGEWRDTEGVSSEEDEEVSNCVKGNFEEWEEISGKGKSILRKHQEKKFLRSEGSRRKRKQGVQPRLTMPMPRQRIVSSLPDELFEVFSISVHLYDAGGAFSLFGTIEAESCMIYSRDEANGEIMHSGETIVVADIGHCYKGPCFGLHFDLKDGNGREISYGYVTHNDATTENWYDRRMCSVVPGKVGCAVVHYSLFTDAIQANLKVIFTSSTGMGVWEVHGNIRARYSSYTYRSFHDMTYYQSILFEKGMRRNIRDMGESECVELQDGDEFPLSKSTVAVPCNASLIVEANLFVSLKGSQNVELESPNLKGKAKFKAKSNMMPGRCETNAKPKKHEIVFQTIGEAFKLQICVEWIGLV